jgi:HSP20 family protein
MKHMKTMQHTPFLTAADFFTPFFSRQENSASAQAFVPQADVVKTEAGFSIFLALPGLAKEDVHLKLEGNLLRISGERKSIVDSEKANHLRSEIRTGQFSRSFNLDRDQLNLDAVEALMDNGLLEVRIPFLAKQQARQIEIR